MVKDEDEDQDEGEDEDEDEDKDGWVRGQERLGTGLAGAVGGAAVVEEIR